MAEAPHRLFVAVPVPATTRDACRALIEPVRTLPYGRYARWVHLDTLHVTLRFLGDTAPERVPDVIAAVRDGVGDRPAFEVRLGGAGAFPPDGHKIRALWLGIAEGADGLGSIVEDLVAPLARLGWPAETRPFRPHLTVARTDRTGIRDAALIAQALEGVAADWTTSFVADRVILFRSHLGGGPPRHEPVDEILLRATEG
ncbi:MAG TPA: RNA 2',3'-cyclic phosphodiesterase [Candidatus Limnocylindrales bacterium]